MTELVHVLLADDHEIVRSGLRSILKGQADFAVVGEASDGAEAIEKALETRPELVVMDVRMPRVNGIEACREIRAALPQTYVLILTSFADERAVMAAIIAGASGFMLKEVHTSELMEAMRHIARGGKTLDPSAAAAVMEQVRKGTLLSEEDRLAQRLSERELRVLDLIAEGLTNREIGEQLYLSEKTIKHHVSDILAKLGLARRVEAAAFAIRRASNHQG